MQNDNKLYELRTSRHLTQKEFAEKVGMNAGVYSRYERGENDIPLSVAAKIARAFDISIDYIAGYSTSEQGIYGDKEKQVLQKSIVDPIIETGGNEKELLHAYIKHIRDEQSKANEASETAVAQIMKIINEKYPENK